MKFSTERATLLKALAHVQSVAEKRNTIPILANVLIQVTSQQVSLKATDMEIEVVERIPASIASEGSCTAPAAVLYDIVRKLPDDVLVELDQTESDGLHLRAGRYATRLNVLPVDDFPSMGSGDFPHKFQISSSILQSLVDRTRFAISTEETRYYLNGIYLHVADVDGEEKLRAVATDGHRLARAETGLPSGAAGISGVIIPRKTVNELRKLMEETEEEVSVALSDTRIQFVVGAITLTSKLIDGVFPDYERVIPQNNNRVLIVDRKAFSEAVARVAAISQERSRPVKLTLKTGLLVLSANSPERGTAKEELDDNLISYSSEELEVGFQARYLGDIMDQVESEAEFVFADSTAPVIVRSIGVSSALYVIMPMRV
ncbi:MAG: DNA polymerase III subunit beta [Acetobacter sp.]|nr:DNA polymerase III subunit beta [Acetobacter sp.]